MTEEPHTGANWIRPPGPIAPGLRIGLLGGSFNPPHEGHLHISKVALKRLGLDYVWWLVSPQNPLKSANGMAPLPERFAEAAAFAGHPRIVVTDIERALGTRYTVDSVKLLKRRFVQLHFVWLMGSDNLASFQRWRRWREIAARVPIAVITRPGSVLAALHAKPIQRFARMRRHGFGIAHAKPPAIAIVDGPRIAQSSTAIRAGRQTR